MNPEVTAALITLLGTLVLLAAGNLITTAFFAGRMTERIQNVDDRVRVLESLSRETALAAARLEGKFDSEI
jgi:hypothetical protein